MQRALVEQQIEAKEHLEGLRAGLGQQKKQRMRMMMKGTASPSNMQSVKAKTLASKREKLEQDIMKYGVAAIEVLYPRQERLQQQVGSLKINFFYLTSSISSIPAADFRLPLRPLVESQPGRSMRLTSLPIR